MKPETALAHNIRLALNRTARCRIVRNNTGVDLTAGVRYGLGEGGADLVGILRGTGRAFCLEVKTPMGRVRPEQTAWLATVRRFGGFASVVTSIDDALRALERAETGLCE